MLDSLLQQDVLWFQIAVDQVGFVQKAQRIQKLLGKYADEGCAQATELVLLDQFVEIDAEQFECQTKMLAMNKCVFQPEQVVVIVLVIFTVELSGSD